jgi:hypothetical protein
MLAVPHLEKQTKAASIRQGKGAKQDQSLEDAADESV